MHEGRRTALPCGALKDLVYSPNQPLASIRYDKLRAVRATPGPRGAGFLIKLLNSKCPFGPFLSEHHTETFSGKKLAVLSLGGFSS